MTYAVAILRRAQREIATIPTTSLPRIRDAIRSLGGEPRPTGCRKLAGREGWRIRVGDYRVIYEIDDDERVVTILHVGHRRDIYR